MTCRQPRAASRSVTCSANRTVFSPAIAIVAVVWCCTLQAGGPGLDGGHADRRHRGLNPDGGGVSAAGPSVAVDTTADVEHERPRAGAARVDGEEQRVR